MPDAHFLTLALRVVIDNLAQIRDAEHSGRDLALDSVFDIDALLRSIDAYFSRNTLLIREEPT